MKLKVAVVRKLIKETIGELNSKLSQGEIAVLREFDFELDDFDPTSLRALQSEINEFGEALLEAGYMEINPDGSWSTTDLGREQYSYWNPDQRARELEQVKFGRF